MAKQHQDEGNHAPNWQWRNPLPQGNPLFAVAFEDEKSGWVAGGQGSSLLTTDGGRSWKRQTGCDIREDLHRIFFLDSRLGWAVGHRDSSIIHTEDGGSTWRHLRKGGELFDPIHGLYDIHFADQLTGWAVGSAGALLSTTDGGKTWSEQRLCKANLHGLARQDRKLWVAGDWGTILHSPDLGITWEPQKGGTGRDFRAVCFVDEMTGWVAGGGDSGCWPTRKRLKDPSAVLLHTQDGGKSWKRIPKSAFQGPGSSRLSPIKSICFRDRWRGWMVMAERPFYTSTGGRTWIALETGLRDMIIERVVNPDYNRVLVVGSDGGVLASDDRGDNWRKVDIGTTRHLHDICFPCWDRPIVVGDGGTIIQQYIDNQDLYEEIKRFGAAPEEKFDYRNDSPEERVRKYKLGKYQRFAAIIDQGEEMDADPVGVAGHLSGSGVILHPIFRERQGDGLFFICGKKGELYVAQSIEEYIEKANSARTQEKYVPVVCGPVTEKGEYLVKYVNPVNGFGSGIKSLGDCLSNPHFPL